MIVDRGSGRTLSPWMDTADSPVFSPLGENRDADVCVVGAGIAGLSVAYELAVEGKSVVVLEDGETIGAGETARTTAHLSNAFDDRYHLVEQLHGVDGARLTAESHTAAIDEIERIVRAEGIDCQFERVDGYLFTPPGDAGEELGREYEACRTAGLTDVTWVDRAPIHGFETGRCLRFPRQGQFHPMRYLAGLARAIVDRGGRIHTGTHATTIEGGKKGTSGRVETKNGFVVTARDVVVATNTPVQDWLTIHTKQYSYRTYVLAARMTAGLVANALLWDTAHPYHYVRLLRRGDEDLLIVGGEDHKTGQEKDGVDPYERLAAWARERYPLMGDIVYRWSGQVIEPMDRLAHIGRNPGDENVWIVTGDSGNGMTHAAIAGLLLRDLVAGREHRWEKLYEPGRKSLRAALEFTRENMNMAAQYKDWLTAGDVDDESAIVPGSGGLIREGLKKVAVHRDRDGVLHHLSAVCPHLGAVVHWNAREGTWDCPAHGSRFDALGKVINGPSNADLTPLDADVEAKDSGR